MTQRLSVSFSDETYKAMKEIANRESCTISQVVRHFTNLGVLVHGAVENGGRIYIEEQGEHKELVLLL